MTMQDQTTIEHEVPATTQGEASTITNYEEPAKSTEAVSQSTDSTDPLKEQDELQAEPDSAWAELDGTLEGLGGAVSTMDALITGTYGGVTPSDRRSKLKELLELANRLSGELHDAIALNEKLVDERSEMEKFAQERRYENFDALCAAYGYVKAEDQINKQGAPDTSTQSPTQAPAQPKAKRKRGDKPWKPNDRLLQSHLTASLGVELDAGYRSDERIWPNPKWVTKFRAMHGRMPKPNDCRDATDKEIQQQIDEKKL